MRRRGFLAAVAGLAVAGVVKVPKPVFKLHRSPWRNYAFRYSTVSKAELERRLRAAVAAHEVAYWTPPVDPIEPWGIRTWLTA